MAALTLITRVGDIKYFICDTYANLASQKPNWTGAQCRVDDGTWYEWRQFNDDLGNGSWEVYSGPPISLSITTGAVSESNPLPVKTSLLSATPVTIYNEISATPTTPYTLVVDGQNYKGLKIITSGTATGIAISYSAKVNSGDTAEPICALNWSTGKFEASTTAIGEIIEFTGFDGIYSITITPTTLSGGTLTILGRILY